MKLCPTCGQRWDTVGTHCPHDGTPLVVSEAKNMGEAKDMGDRSLSSTWSAQQPALAEPRVAPTDELKPGTCVGEYVIERRIGAGGMGVVYGARHPVIGKRAAIKILNAKQSADEEAMSRFVLEAQAVNKIGHANIVDIFSFGTLDDGRSYFAMEWLQGETLGQRLARGSLSRRETIDILSALCRALEAAHAAGVIHRDLKPDNVFLTVADEGWRVKLLDFGIAKLSTETASISRTATGVAMGTPLYMAPEQARGEPVDGRTDVYALGLVAYTVVCGEALFQDETSAVEILAAHICKPPPSPRVRAPDLPVAFEKLILDMIAKDPALRPPLVEVRQRLAAIAAALDHGSLSPPSPAGPATMRVSADLLQQSRPPGMPPEMPGMPPGMPPMPGMPPEMPPQVAKRSTEMQSSEVAKQSTAKQSSEVAKQSAAMPIAGESIPGDPSETDDIVLPRRSRWPMAVIAGAVLAAGVVMVVAIRRQGAASQPAQPAPAESRLAVTSPPVPATVTPAAAVAAMPPAPAPVAVEVTPPAPTPAVVETTPAAPDPAAVAASPPAQVTAELVVEPGHARLAVDGRPVTLAGGRATLALSPGDHVATARVGARKTSKSFVVTAGHPATVSLQVPVADSHVVPPKPPPSPVDVDAVQDPFHR